MELGCEPLERAFGTPSSIFPTAVDGWAIPRCHQLSKQMVPPWEFPKAPNDCLWNQNKGPPVGLARDSFELVFDSWHMCDTTTNDIDRAAGETHMYIQAGACVKALWCWLENNKGGQVNGWGWSIHSWFMLITLWVTLWKRSPPTPSRVRRTARHRSKQNSFKCFNVNTRLYVGHNVLIWPNCYGWPSSFPCSHWCWVQSRLSVFWTLCPWFVFPLWIKEKY